jgi:hypothetical protein
MILATPAFRVRLYVPLAIPALRLKQRFIGPGHVKSHVKAKMLTHDPEQAALYDADPLIFRQIAVNVLIGLHDAGTRLLADAGAIHLPTLMLSAGRDWVVSLAAQRRFFNGSPSRTEADACLPGGVPCFVSRARARRVIDRVATASGSTGRRLCALLAQSRPVRPHTGENMSASSCGAALIRIRAGWIENGGRLSKGVALGWRTGFDSGLTLDYVYENRARGTTPLAG